MHNEQTFLQASIVITLILAIVGIVFGLLSGSYAIVFDGIYSLTDASMTIVALLVARLIATASRPSPAGSRRLMDRFTMGFWHLEPMVLALNGTLLTGAAIYALINAIGSLMAGGRELDFDHAIIYAVITAPVALAMAILGRMANRRTGSDLLALDAKAWAMSAALTAALLVAFLFGYLIQGTSHAWFSPYIDPAVLALVCMVIIPIPLGTVRQALSEILLVAPPELNQHVNAVAQDFVQRCGFLSHRAYVAQVGRGRQIELYFIVPPGWPPKRLEEWDRLRDRIGEAIGDESPDRWLTIAFTTDPTWAD